MVSNLHARLPPGSHVVSTRTPSPTHSRIVSSWYKTPDGKALNAFGHNEAALDRDMAYKVIAETHHHWHDLMANPMDGLWTS